MTRYEARWQARAHHGGNSPWFTAGVWTLACLLGACGASDASTLSGEVRTVFPMGGACDGPGDAVGPEPGEYGHFAAGRIDLGGERFIVRGVRYRLEAFLPEFPDVPCDPDLEHEVWLFVTEPQEPWNPEEVDVCDAPAPPAAVTPDRVVRVPRNQGRGQARQVEVAVDELTVEPGQELYVAVQMAGSAAAHLCIGVCGQPGQNLAATHFFWSNATEPEFDWDNLLCFAVNAAPAVEVVGSP